MGEGSWCSVRHRKEGTTRSLFFIHSWHPTLAILPHAHHSRHQSTSTSTKECHQRSFHTSTSDFLYSRGKEREVLAFPPRLGGTAITNTVKLPDVENRNSISLTRSLTDKIIVPDADGEIKKHVHYLRTRGNFQNTGSRHKKSLAHLIQNLPADICEEEFTQQRIQMTIVVTNR